MGMFLVDSWSIFLAIDITANSAINVDHHNQICHRSGMGNGIVERGSGTKGADLCEAVI